MPIQQAVDVAVDLETAYNQFTQFEDWPQFMHRVINVSQDDDDTIRFTTKIWGKTKEFEAKILNQRPDDRIMWKVAQGITHAGVVSFHELAPRLTRIELTLDVKPGSLIEKAARGMRHVKRAVRADLHRYKAFIEMQELETGAWRGVIEDGEVVEPHDESYDEERDYSEVEDLQEQFGDSGEGDSGEDEPDDEPDEEVRRERPRERARRRTPAAA
jgi:Polyketide cyclase / dehydrase and lipid transport